MTDLERSRAALPGLNEAVGELRKLSSIATETFAGRAFDTVSKELGFGPTKGKTARTKFIAVIDNQVLPLLKETFGAAFTVQEGENLKATMGDPNASHEERMAQLDAFIAQKQEILKRKKPSLTNQISKYKTQYQQQIKWVDFRLRWLINGNIPSYRSEHRQNSEVDW